MTKYKRQAQLAQGGTVAQNNKIGSWSDIQVILAVARLGSFQSAANFLNINQSTVGRRIQRLEATLGTKVFDRHVGGMRLSPAGKLLFDKALAMETAAQDIEIELSGLDTTLAGTVTISVTEGLGYLWLAGVMAEFSAQHPEMDIELITDRQGLRLLHHDADVSIVIERPKDPRLEHFPSRLTREGRASLIHLACWRGGRHA